MEIIWEYSLTTNNKSDEYQYRSPIIIHGDYLYYVSDCIHDKRLHFINTKTGIGTSTSIKKVHMHPSSFFGFVYDNTTVFYTGNLYFIQKDNIIKNIKLSQIGLGHSNLRIENKLYISIFRKAHESLLCINLDSMEISWSIDITNKKPYIAGELSLFDNMISCPGRDMLLFINPVNGEITNSLKISRINKLYCPIRLDNEHLLIGYTNWTTAGILKYHVPTKKVIWKHNRKFEGPQGNCKIYLYKGNVYWAKNGTEIIGLNSDTGDELLSIKATPWLYTDLKFIENGILYGTAGSDGYLNYVDYSSGKNLWSEFLKEGCEFYDMIDDNIYTGDYAKNLKQIRLSDGHVVNTLSLDAEVVGQITISENELYTVIWGNKEKDIRLVKIKL